MIEPPTRDKNESQLHRRENLEGFVFSKESEEESVGRDEMRKHGVVLRCG